MSQITVNSSGSTPPGSNVQTLTGDTGGAVGPTGGNINIVGDGTTISFAGNPPGSTITASVADIFATTYTTDDANFATPSGYNLNVFGGLNITTTSAGDTVTIQETSARLLNNYSVANASPYVVQADDYYITVDTSTIPITIQLPDAPTQYQVFIIKDSPGNASVNNITVTTVSGVLVIDAATSFVMNTDYQAIQVVYSGFGYEVF